MPGPLSRTLSTAPVPWRAMLIDSRRSAGGTRASACSALASRLCTTCSRPTGSACTSSASLPASRLGTTPWRRHSGSSRYSALRTVASSRTGCSAPLRSGRSTVRRNRCSTSAARLAWAAACVIASRAVARSGGSSPISRAAACVLASSAVSGWFSSWARPAASSPSVFSRATWPRRSSSSARRRSPRWRCTSAPSANTAATVASQPAMRAHGSADQPSVRPSCTSNGWLSAARRLLNASFHGPSLGRPACKVQRWPSRASSARTAPSRGSGQSVHGTMRWMSISSA